MKAATVIIDRQALHDNLAFIRKLAPGCKVMSVVKANGYGHGLVEVAKTLQESDCFGVARLSEALMLRDGGVKTPVLLLEGFIFPEELPILVARDIETVVHSEEQLEALEQAELDKPIRVWMKLDTGMHRLGVRPEQFEQVYQRLSQCKNVVQPVNLVSHFSRADEPEVGTTLEQIACFEQLTQGKPGERSMAASGGVLSWPESYYDWIRPGIISYGVSPFSDKTGPELGLHPAMTLKSSLIAVRQHKTGEPVGYNAIWTSDRDTCLGVVAIGYGDGYPRQAPSGTPVLVNGRRVPLVGRVSMDMIVVDLGPNATEKLGDDVILWGESLPVEEIAEHTGFSAYELLTKLTGRVVIEYIN